MTDPIANYYVRYPSGAAYQPRGQFLLLPLDTTRCPSITLETGGVLMLDQRAIVTCDGAIVYSPRRNADGLGAVMVEWLKEHPEWDRIKPQRTRR